MAELILLRRRKPDHWRLKEYCWAEVHGTDLARNVTSDLHELDIIAKLPPEDALPVTGAYEVSNLTLAVALRALHSKRGSVANMRGPTLVKLRILPLGRLPGHGLDEWNETVGRRWARHIRSPVSVSGGEREAAPGRVRGSPSRPPTALAIPPFRRCTPASRACLDFCCDVCLNKKLTVAQGPPPLPYHPQDPFQLHLRNNVPTSPSETTDPTPGSSARLRAYEEADSAGRAFRSQDISPTLAAPRGHPSTRPRDDLGGAHADDPSPMTGGPCPNPAATETAPARTNIFQTSTGHATLATSGPKAGPSPPDAAAAANTAAAAWLRGPPAPEQAPGHSTTDPRPTVVSIATPRSSTAEREGHDPHLAATELEDTEPPPQDQEPGASDDAELFAPAPRSGNVTPVRRPVIDIDDDDVPGPPPGSSSTEAAGAASGHRGR